MIQKIIVGTGIAVLALWLLQRCIVQRWIPLPQSWRILLASSLLFAATGAKAKSLPVEKSAEWKTVERAWNDPTDTTIDRAKSALDTLEAATVINKEESALLWQSLAAKRPRTPPPPNAACYKPMPSPDWSAYNRLNKRLPYLESIVDSTELHPVVWRTLLEEIKQDLSEMRSGEPQERKANLTEKATMRARVEKVIARIEKKLSPAAHRTSPGKKP
jgi:hypothetical protein